jgi:hypothetical protein
VLDLVLAILLAAAGQVLISRHDLRGLVPYALATILLLLLLRRNQHLIAWQVKAPAAPRTGLAASALPYHRIPKLVLLSLTLATAAIAYVGAADNTFRGYGVAAWLLSIVLFLAAFWERNPDRSLRDTLRLSADGWRIGGTVLVLFALILIGAYFRFWQLGAMPSEMTSDHIEKLLDVHDLVMGKRPIFFVRNTGREPWQFYWTLMFIRIFDLQTKYFALKLGAAAVGLLMLPGIYLLGRELFSRRVGLWATLFGAVASWPVILSRIGLRFPFAPAATVWSLLYLLRGLRDGKRNDFLLLGLWLGIGLQGYTAFRAMPLAVVVCWALAWWFRPARLAVQRRPLLRNALLTIAIAGIVFIPLGRFSLEHPDDFWRRSFSRIADPVAPPAHGPILTFVTNLRDLLLMFHWQGDNVWVNTLMGTPILDPLLGALFLLGLVIVFWRVLKLRDAISLLLVVAGFILLLPSALSLAFPVENPSVVRTGGAIPAVMIIAALPLGLEQVRGLHISAALRRRHLTPPQRWEHRLQIGAALVFALLVIGTNYRRYFVDYWKQYQSHALNTTEIASAVKGFAESGGNLDNAWIVAWPHWIDTRGVGIEMGDPPWNNVILESEQLDEQAALPATGEDGVETRPRFYVLFLADFKTLEKLKALFPSGWSSRYVSAQPGRDFFRFYVPKEPEQGAVEGIQYETASSP